ncbi:sensor histidine kinase [Galbitalea soli]|uniref:histidine kinase n=1 Tax=Galbitalea soli TaxID=1268042 RepID=A0A7C9TTT5_9MICO|nr:HAMP domain-containing sensor histidine kinase [Galbitalea soli]NEM92382.1 HAMP domain-containing histidine kinase [Galbitalea soli]NYJ31661.1 two-component system OmpR family sensor kinase [Galbitalea soli]
MHSELTEWWNGISLRSKITGVTVMLLTLGLLVAGVGTMTYLRTYLLQEVNTKIAAVGADITDAMDSACSTTKLAAPFYVAMVNSSGEITCDNSYSASEKPVISKATLPHVISNGDTFTLTDAARDTNWQSAGFVVGGGHFVVVVSYNLTETDGTIGHFALIFLFFSLTVVVLGGALTRLLVTSTFAPLREVEETAARFAAGDFSQRLERGPRNTEVGRLNDSLNTMLGRIDAAFADRAKNIEQMRRFVGDASHELRTPLVSVRGYAELYRMGALGTQEEVAQAMERIEKEAIRMGELVGDLLELARIDEAKPLNLTAVDLVPLAHDAALDAMASAPERRVTVVVTEPIRATASAIEADRALDAAVAGAPRTASMATRPIALAGATLSRLARRPRKAAPLAVQTLVPVDREQHVDAIVLAEENKIRQVITNLMGNALRFTEPDSPIEIGVTVDERDDVAILSVIDHGEGIPPQIREKIFQRFWRADSSRNRDTGGSGLGLAIVASIVASHKGSVDVVDTAGGGSTFRVRLPLLHETPRSAALHS